MNEFKIVIRGYWTGEDPFGITSVTAAAATDDDNTYIYDSVAHVYVGAQGQEVSSYEVPITAPEEPEAGGDE